MSNIVENLKLELISELNKADEVWIAVALITSTGFDFLQGELKKGCSQNYLIGINLPTEPEVLKKLYKLEIKNEIKSRVYAGKSFYHPKVYLIKKSDTYVAFVGSANCTISGISKNIELSYKIENQIECEKLIEWFDKSNKDAFSLKKSFIEEYGESFKRRKMRKKEDEDESEKLKEKLRRTHEVTMAARKELIDILKRYRKQSNYNKHKAERKENVNKLRQSVDYPTFENIDVDEFFRIHELGHLIAIPVPTIKTEINKFRRMLKYLSDETIDIETRINEVLSGDLKIRGVAEAMVSKILTIHDPKEYSIRNHKIDDVLVNYGIEIPKRISKGERYKAVNKFLKEIAKESNIDNMAVLDLYLYMEAIEND